MGGERQGGGHVLNAVAAVAVAGAMALVAAGCGGGTSATTASLGTGGSSTTAASTSTPAPTSTTTANALGRSWVEHVVWIVMENKRYGQIIGSPDAPYINGLAGTYGLATNMTAVSHPSLPNYIAMTSGSTQGVTDDAGPGSHPLSDESIFGQTHGDWRALEESMPGNCDRGNSGDYANRHNPAVYYTALAAECAARDVPLGATPEISARFTFITPNLQHDTHDTSVATGDAWLKRFVPTLLDTPEYRSGKTVLFITWDEDDRGSNNHIATIVVSPKTKAVSDGTAFTHYSLLRTTEDLLGLPLLGLASTAPSMRSAFGL